MAFVAAEAREKMNKPIPNASSSTLFSTHQRQLWPLGGLLFAILGLFLLSQDDPAAFWGRLRWPEAAIPGIALLIGLPWSVVDVARSIRRGNEWGIIVAVIAGIINVYIGYFVIVYRPK